MKIRKVAEIQKQVTDTMGSTEDALLQAIAVIKEAGDGSSADEKLMKLTLRTLAAATDLARQAQL
jgi:hypothetical protein